MRFVVSLLLFSLCSCSYGGMYNNIHEELILLSEEIAIEITYEAEGGRDYFQSPEETVKLKTGDCEDFAIYFMWKAKEMFNINVSFIIAYVEDVGFHALCSYEDVYYDPTLNLNFEELPSKMTEIASLNYSTVMLYATGFYTKGDLNDDID